MSKPEVDDDEEDLDEEEEELAREDGFIEEDIPDDTEDVQRRAAQDNQRLDRFRRQEEDTNAEALAEELRQRYGRSARYAASPTMPRFRSVCSCLPSRIRACGVYHASLVERGTLS